MPKLTMILGRAGSGKTELLLERVCRRAAQSPLASAQHPPLLVVVPEQQALMTEQALLAKLGELLGLPAATSRIRVMSLSRLGNWLASEAGQLVRRDGDLGRRLLVWRILSEMEQDSSRSGRQARVEQLSEVLAELRQFGTSPEQLRQRSAQLATQPALSRSAEELPQRLLELAELHERYLTACDELGLQFASSAANIERLLSSRLWPFLEQTEVYIDGFAGFTPPEEAALLAILSRTASVTVSVLLDPQRIEGPLPVDSADWFGPGRELFESMAALAQRAGIRPELVPLSDSPRWQGEAMSLATLAEQGAMPAGKTDASPPLHCVLCNDERTETLEAVRIVRRLMRDEGLRSSEISIIARDLAPYAELLQMRLAEHGIPAFIDRRMPLSYHPLLQLVRGILRIASGLAGNEELTGLLRCGLLPFEDDSVTQQQAVDRLLVYSDTHGLSVSRWLDGRDWNWHREMATEEGRGRPRRDPALIREELARLDGWRRMLLADAVALRDYLLSGSARLGGLLELLAALLDRVAERHALNAGDELVLSRVRDLLNEMQLVGEAMSVGNDEGLELRTLVNWLEYGFSRLQQAMPPLRQEHLLVTEVERGRHHPVRASILLGLADGSWPSPAVDSPWFSDSQRELINGTEKLLSGGAREDCLREPWLAMIALTRASQQLHLLRPAADSEGRARPMSPWYRGLLGWTAAKERLVSHEQSQALSQVESEGDLVVAVALSGGRDRTLPGLSVETERALGWATGWGGRRRSTQQLDRGLLGAQLQDGVLSCSATRLETFAACPYKHYVRYWLRLDEQREPAFDALTLGNMYHSVFERTVQRLNAEGYDWVHGDWQRISEASQLELAALREALFRETARERVDYVLERAGILLEQHSRSLRQWLAGHGERRPLQTELRFGGQGAELPPYELDGNGMRIRISGFIDRLDIDSESRATVIDYKLGGRKQQWNRLLAGYQLQLFVYMLAVRGRSVAGSTALEAADAEYQPLEVQWDKDGYADFEPTQALKPSGRVKEEDAPAIRMALHDWAVSETQRVLLELGGRLAAGEVRAWPLSDGRSFTACNGCSYRSICRFDPVAGDAYREMLPLGNQDIQKLILEGKPDFTGSALRSILGSGEDGDA
ncbi:MAG: PD-(D/E)XK nuclease family protein [Planctomycetales bacterium]|nr:PD-(D/E)XK nuclease family protein [bacterium]UNM09211.1 MAG: PD-(D/E)XK nuclease family protein [Planctomycetales bacterium]